MTLTLQGGVYQGDDFRCLVKDGTTLDADINETCAESSIYSPYIDPNLPQFINGTQQWSDCQVSFLSINEYICL